MSLCVTPSVPWPHCGTSSRYQHRQRPAIRPKDSVSDAPCTANRTRLLIPFQTLLLSGCCHLLKLRTCYSRRDLNCTLRGNDSSAGTSLRVTSWEGKAGSPGQSTAFPPRPRWPLSSVSTCVRSSLLLAQPALPVFCSGIANNRHLQSAWPISLDSSKRNPFSGTRVAPALATALFTMSSLVSL